eukprot:1161635-Prymnesium_polylepis.1
MHDDKLVPLGWIHTHPKIRVFMSSVDLHQQVRSCAARVRSECLHASDDSTRPASALCGACSRICYPATSGTSEHTRITQHAPTPRS